MALTCVFACLGVGLFVASNKTVNASAATQEELVAEFTHNGLFTLGVSSQSGSQAANIIDGSEATVTLPSGYEGAVLELNRSSSPDGYDLVTVDFSSSSILAADVKSIVVRMWVDNFNSANDEFRTLKPNTSTAIQYGVGKFDFSNWCDVTLNENSIASMTDSNGFLSAIDLGLCDKSAASHVYIDSITVTLVEYTTYELGPTCLHANSIPGGTNHLYLTLSLYAKGMKFDEAGNEKEFTWVDGTGVLVNGVQISPVKFKQADKSFFRFYTANYGIETYLTDGTTPDEVTVGGTFVNTEVGVKYIL